MAHELHSLRIMNTPPLTPLVAIAIFGLGCSGSQYDTNEPEVPQDVEPAYDTGVDYDFNAPGVPSQGPENPQVVPPPRAAPNPSPTPMPETPELGKPDATDLSTPAPSAPVPIAPDDPSEQPGPRPGSIPPRPVTALR